MKRLALALSAAVKRKIIRIPLAFDLSIVAIKSSKRLVFAHSAKSKTELFIRFKSEYFTEKTEGFCISIFSGYNKKNTELKE